MTVVIANFVRNGIFGFGEVTEPVANSNDTLICCYLPKNRFETCVSITGSWNAVGEVAGRLIGRDSQGKVVLTT